MTTDPLLASSLERIRELEARLEESEETLAAIGRGDFDAVVTKNSSTGLRVYTLENADSPYRLLIEQIQDGAMTLNAEGTVFYCNRRLAAMLETPQERVIGQKLQPFVQKTDLANFDRLLRSARQGHARSELVIRNSSGLTIPVNLSLNLLSSDDGHPLLCGLMADLTEQKRYLEELSEINTRLVAAGAQRQIIEDTLRQSQKMEAVGQLTGGLAHDFNNLLAVILGNLELVQTGLENSHLSGLKDYVDSAMTSVNRGAALTHRLLAFSRLQALAPKSIAPNQLIRGMMELLRRTAGPGMTIETILPDDTGLIFCDPHQLENALLNLAINARDAMAGGGTLTIATSNIDADSSFADSRDMAPGQYVALSVTDTGTGMPQTVIARAFDPFFTTKALGQGTGLGLSMIYGFAKQSGGQARIHSIEGVGSTISIFLPRHIGVIAPVVNARPRAETPRARPSETVLVVDDEPGIRILLSRNLGRLGYAVLEGSDGKSDLQHIQGDERIDLLVTDFGLTGSMNGWQLAEAARLLRPDLKVLFITGFAKSMIAGNRFMEPGMEVMNKPFAMTAFLQRIASMINTAHTGSSVARPFGSPFHQSPV